MITGLVALLLLLIVAFYLLREAMHQIERDGEAEEAQIRADCIFPN